MAQYEGYEDVNGVRTVGDRGYDERVQMLREELQKATVPKMVIPEGALQGFSSGATRTSDASKFDYEGFLSPLVVEAFAEYMHENRGLASGGMRASDNWQLGIPFHKYMKSLWRHFWQMWAIHRGYKVKPEMRTDGTTYVPTVKLAALGILFNTMGYLHEYLKDGGKAWDTRKVSDEEGLNHTYKQPGKAA